MSMGDLRPTRNHRKFEREDKPWQTERGMRFGQQRKMMAKSKVKARKQERARLKNEPLELE
jgi:hypothetical protein